ncbi:hypothetical protein L1987_78555 [Smallanthus sonchifolius]|uniref:Uncharacterized protein n=1 Tax=Smallanthus sonchifolius TaxID=185202 RepID=A0ACB8ZD91_9ASTR|nr:hypothetical protein L1987_78555 [Smallanthus sonchifolius]
MEMTGKPTLIRRQKLAVLLHTSEPNVFITTHHQPETTDHRRSNASYPSPPAMSSTSSPVYFMSPFNNMPSPYSKSPWVHLPYQNNGNTVHNTGFIGSLIREEVGHIYSLASSGDLLYTGSDSNNIRVWKNLMEFSGFKSSSGLVKAIIVSGDRVFTGHQDGKIRVWRYLSKKKSYKRVGSLPTTKDYIKTSMNPNNYIEVRRRRNVPWIKHYDAVACMSLDEEHGLLYSGSWDKSMKVWRLSDSKCLESVAAHNDAINSVAVGFDGLVFTGSADGTVKVWRREFVGKMTKHLLVHTLLEQDSAVTSVAVNATDTTVYAGSSDGLVNFWVREKQMLSHGGVLRGHKLAVLCLATSGNLVLSGSADNSICVWRREGGGIHSCLSVLNGHTGPVKCLAVQERSKDEDQNDEWIVYSGSLDNSVKLWRVSEQPQIFNF